MTELEELALKCANNFLGWKGTWHDLDEHCKIGCLKAAQGIMDSSAKLAEHINTLVLHELIKAKDE